MPSGTPGGGGNASSADTTVAGTASSVMVNVSYTLWVGSNVNETYNLTVTAPKNETFYGVMLLAAEMSSHFQFTASEWPNGHYVHTLAGYKEEPMSYHYWLLYRLPSPPEPSSPPGNQLVAPGGTVRLSPYCTFLMPLMHTRWHKITLAKWHTTRCDSIEKKSSREYQNSKERNA